MAFVKQDILSVNSDQEEYFYHLEEASYHLKCAEQAQHEVDLHFEKFKEHNCWLHQHSNNNFTE